MRKSTYNFGMVRFGTENLDVVEFDDFHSAVLRSLAGRGSDVFVDDEFAEAPRGAVQEEVALLVVLAHDDRDFSLFNNKGTCIGTQSVVKRYQYHAVAVRRLLGEDPLGAILRVDPDEGGTRSESLRHHPRAEVLGPEKGLVVVQPLVGFVVGFPPAQTGTVI
jgi:hypothetical protein